MLYGRSFKWEAAFKKGEANEEQRADSVPGGASSRWQGNHTEPRLPRTQFLQMFQDVTM